MKNKPLFRPLWIALIYLVFAGAWITFSDAVINALFPHTEPISHTQALKNLVFVLITLVFVGLSLAKSGKTVGGDSNDQDRKQGKLLDLAEQFRVIAGANYDAFWIWDIKDGKVAYVSPGFEDLWHIPAERLYDDPMAFMDAVHPEDKGQAAECLNLQGKAGGQSHHFRIVRPDGSEGWIKIATVVSTGDEGEPQKLSVMVEDISEALEQIKQLRRQRDLVRHYLDVAGAIMVAIDREEKVVMVNRRGCEILGYPESEIMGRNWFDYFVPEHMREQVREVFHQIVKGHIEPVETYENPVIIKGGATRLVQWSNAIIYDQNGEFEASLSYGDDITEKRQAQEGRLRLMRAVEQAAEGIAIINTDGVTDYVNPSFVEIIRTDKEEIVGKSIFDRIGQDGPGQDANLQLSILAKAAREPHQTQMIRTDRNGREKHLEMTISPVREKDRLLSGFVVVLHDVTDLRQLENKLRQSQKMEAIGTLAGGIAHDFNNILGSIMGYTELAAWDLPSESIQKRHLEQVLMAGERAKELVGQILSFSRQGEKERRPIRLSSIIKETVKLLRASLPATIEIESSLEKETGSVLSDPVQIQQIVMNLATNAAQAIGGQTGVITVALGEKLLDSSMDAPHPDLKPGMYSLLVVSDTGSGISKENIAKIYDPYFSTKKPGEGTGLGLAMVHGIVLSHGGAVSVYSEIGQGTTFKVYLPRITTEASESAAFDYSVFEGDERVLLVDDEQPLAEAYSGMLSKMGYKVAVQNKPIKALELFKKDPMAYDLVITDYAMPAMSGTDLARQMLEIRPDLPLILCTGFSETISRKMAGSLGFAEFVMKPVLAGQLAESIRKVMDERGKAQ